MTIDIRKRQGEIETEEFDMQPTLEKTAFELYKKDPKMACKFLTRYTNANADHIVDQWWKKTRGAGALLELIYNFIKNVFIVSGQGLVIMIGCCENRH